MKRSHSLFQSFAEMALRNDEARFSVECVLPESQTADEAALLTGWIHTFVQLLHGYEELLSCEWENRTFMRDLDRVLISYGQSLPPYLHGPVTMDPSTANAADFSSYIREYKALLEHREQHCAQLFTKPLLDDVLRIHNSNKKRELPLYIRQLSLLQTLAPGTHLDVPVPIDPDKLHIAVLKNDSYTLIPVYSLDKEGTTANLRPLNRDEISRHISCIVGQQDQSHAAPCGEFTSFEQSLARVPRQHQQAYRKQCGPEAAAALEALSSAPVVINWNNRDSSRPLASLRQTPRGGNDQPLNLIRTGRGMVFDFSHVIFDGLWASRFAHLAAYLAGASVSSIKSDDNIEFTQHSALALPVKRSVSLRIPKQVPDSKYGEKTLLYSGKEAREASAEISDIDVKTLLNPLQRLARLKTKVTLNDLLILARMLHARTYQPGLQAQSALSRIQQLDQGDSLIRLWRQTIDQEHKRPPALLIPVDASKLDPKQRIYMTSIRPADLPEGLLEELVALLHQPDKEHSAHSKEELLHQLAETGRSFRSKFEVALQGRSFSTQASRLFVAAPPPMRYMGDWITEQIKGLRERVKGNELFSNLGRMPSGSTVARFMSSRVKGKAQNRVWGIMTDGQHRLVITLRDFHPYTASLIRFGQEKPAELLVQDYLHAYVDMLQLLVRRIDEL